MSAVIEKTVAGQAPLKSRAYLALAWVLVTGAACESPVRSLGRAYPEDPAAVDAMASEDGAVLAMDANEPIVIIADDDSAPPGARDAFDGPIDADPMRRPVVVYPLSGAMVAFNVAPVTVQWRRPQGTTVFRIRLRGAAGEGRVHAGAAVCPEGQCRVSLPPSFWRQLGSAHAGLALSITVEATAGAGQPVHASTARPLFVAPDELQGGLTYWSSQVNGLMRQPIGENPVPFLAAGSGVTRGHCVGCHAVSSDGCLHAASIEISFMNRQLVMSDAQGIDRSAVPGNETVFQAWSPDRRFLLTALHGKLTLRDDRGRWLDEIPGLLFGEGVEGFVSHPAWSPDGRFIVVTRLPAGSQSTDTLLMSGDIVRLAFRGKGDYGPAEVLVRQDESEFHYYPTVSPDGLWVAFVTGSRPGRSFFTFMPPTENFSPYAQQTSRLRMVPATGGAVVELAQASFAANSTASWPHFAPFTQAGGALYFLVFSAKLDYGFVLQQAGVPARDRSAPGRLQLWIAAIDTRRGGDPSHAPFWLPSQLTEEVNHHAQWTARLPTTASECGL